MTTQTATPRVEPLNEPYSPEVAETLRRMMPPGVEPLKLFRTVAHNPAILERFRTTGAYILNYGTIDPLDREVIIHRTTARCGCEYEWGVHVVAFGRPLGLSDELHDSGTATDDLWAQLAEEWQPAELVELVATVGFYHFVSFIANAL